VPLFWRLGRNFHLRTIKPYERIWEGMMADSHHLVTKHVSVLYDNAGQAARTPRNKFQYGAYRVEVQDVVSIAQVHNFR
jgi:hypothetical protein